ncbi:flagellin [Clostridium tyrobutyricum]|uniref:Flagellin n=1 Tax=Clostridium tyrobutyricum DIVETGP TaxID=1408889 RepID=W6N673_CLOTY|nr:flagellin [Clostridium tyrobutyricum]AND85387.1 A-type flagellin [Clostridium tyrobutyricum]ANP69935.1 flagellin [Clostridium tyrobutyricum]MBV4433989.1 flagellin [Clostridium tyrobutyricum]QNB65703.1 flagellin [Clostridium tyrobutyricum]CDL91660.1 Flagellin protein FlaA [Clostridium tyrobutyricum DIVETGP]
MIINHNLMANNALRNMNVNSNNASKAMEKLSSGLRINRAGDDAAGLAISEKMRGQINGLNQASSNAQDSISLIQTAEGALNETHSILQRMRTLAVQSSNDTNTTTDRSAIQDEVNQLTDEIDRIANTTEFNTQKLLDGSKVGLVDAKDADASVQLNTSANISLASNFSTTSATGIADSFTVTITRTQGTAGATFASTDYDVALVGGSEPSLGALADGSLTYDTKAINLEGDGLSALASGESITISVKGKVDQETDVKKALSMQIGANSGQNMLIGINSMKATDIGVRNTSGKALDISTASKATGAITQINNAIETVSTQRSKLGAYQNRLEHTINNLGTSSENLTSAESRIRDVDMASEMSEYSKNNILSQAAQAMLAQANQQPQQVLQLLR